MVKTCQHATRPTIGSRDRQNYDTDVGPIGVPSGVMGLFQWTFIHSNNCGSNVKYFSGCHMQYRMS